MTTLANYKKSYLEPRVQFIVLNEEGTVLDSDQVLFSVKKNKAIGDFHPFFHGLSELLKTKNEEIAFSCVHLDVDNDQYISDITIKTFDKGEPLIMIHDLTEHYNAYQKLAQSRNESVINSEILAIKHHQLQEKEAFKNQFIANFSHEIRNPLTGIIAFTNIIEKTPLSTEQKDYIEVIKSSGNDLKSILDDILYISKIEAGKIDIKEELVDLHKLLDVVEFTYQTKTKLHKLEFFFNVDEKVPQFVYADPTRLKQVIVNLIENALKFTKRGSITVNVGLNQKRANKVNLKFEVVDTGIGIPKEKQEEIFRSFTQGHDVNKYKGTGLGLAIVKNLLELMGTDIAIESEPKMGSTFHFNINLKYPLNKRELDLPEEEQSYKKKKTPKKYSILLAEDLEINQMIVLKMLAAEGNFYLDILSNGDEVMNTVMSNEYDLILMDIKLPGINGVELAKAIRQAPSKEIKKTPIVAITANTHPDELKIYKKAGINDVIEKPFDEKTLLKKVYKNLK